MSRVGMVVALAAMLAAGQSMAQQVEDVSIIEERSESAGHLNEARALVRVVEGRVAESAGMVTDEDRASVQSARERAGGFERDAEAIAAGSRAGTETELRTLIASEPGLQSLIGAAEAQDAVGRQESPRYRLLVSQSMGSEGLRAVVELARSRPDMVVVFRGIRRDQTMSDLVQMILRMNGPVEEGDAVPTVSLDPVAFREGPVTAVPQLEALGQDGEVIAFVRGVVNPDWIEGKVLSGERGDLGRAGPTTEVVEEDMAVLLQEKAVEQQEAIADRARENVRGFWQQASMVDLPHARVDRTREVDPSVTLVEGFTGPDGTVIAYPGQRINPMDAVPFDQLVIVIDGTDPRQVAWARRKSDEATGVAVTVVTTRINREDGWNHYTGMVVALDQPIYLIPAEMVERFRLERVPATVEGGDRVLIVREYAANEI